MFSHAKTHTVSSFKHVSKIGSIIIITIGCLALIGWIFNIQTLTSILPNLVTMKVNTSLAFILSGLSLRISLVERPGKMTRFICQLCALVVVIVSLLTICEYIFNWNLGIDQALFKDDPMAIGTSNPGRMSPITALNFILAGASLLLINS